MKYNVGIWTINFFSHNRLQLFLINYIFVDILRDSILQIFGFLQNMNFMKNMKKVQRRTMNNGQNVQNMLRLLHFLLPTLKR